jgi:hypothetical protein
MRMHWRGCVEDASPGGCDEDASPGGCDEDESQECNENVLQKGVMRMHRRRV